MRVEEGISPDELERPDWNSLKANYDLHDVGEAYFVGRMNQIGLEVEHWGIDARDDDEDRLIFDNKMDLRLWEPLDGQSDAPTPRVSVPKSGVLEQPVEADQKLLDAADSAGVEDPQSKIEDIEYESWKLRGIADVKTKSNPSWYGVLNLRHLVHYLEWADHFNCPVFLFFTIVNMEEEAVGDRADLVPLSGAEVDNLGQYVDHFDRDTEWSFNAMGNIAEDCDIVSRSFRAPDGNPVVQISDDGYRDFDWFVEDVL